MIDTNELLDFAKCNFSNCLILEKQVKATYDCPTIDLGELCDIKIGGTPPRNNHLYFRGNNLWLSIKEMNGQCITDTVEKITDEAIKASNVKKIKKGTTLISFKLSLGKVAVAGVDLYTNEAIAGLEVVDDNLCLNEYLFELFRLGCINLISSTKSFGNSLNSKTLKTLQIPHLSIDEQRKFIEIAKREQPLDFGSIKDVEQIVKLRTQKFNNVYSQVNS